MQPVLILTFKYRILTPKIHISHSSQPLYGSLGQRMILLAVEVYHHPFHQHFLGLTHLQDTFWAFCFDPNQVPIIDLSKSHDFFFSLPNTLTFVLLLLKCSMTSTVGW